MQHFQKRRGSRIIAFIDLVLTLISIWTPILLLVGAIKVSFMSKEDEQKISKAIKNELANGNDKGITEQDLLAAAVAIGAKILWAFFIASCVDFIIRLEAALELLSGTQKGKDGAVGAKQCRFWRNTHIIFTVVWGALGLGLERNPYFLTWGIINIFLHILAIGYVHRFISQLDEAAKKKVLLGGHQTGDSLAVAYTVNETKP